MCSITALVELEELGAVIVDKAKDMEKWEIWSAIDLVTGVKDPVLRNSCSQKAHELRQEIHNLRIEFRKKCDALSKDPGCLGSSKDPGCSCNWEDTDTVPQEGVSRLDTGTLSKTNDGNDSSATQDDAVIGSNN